MITILSLFCGHNLELLGDKLTSYSKSYNLLIFENDHEHTDKAYLNGSSMNNISTNQVAYMWNELTTLSAYS